MQYTAPEFATLAEKLWRTKTGARKFRNAGFCGLPGIADSRMAEEIPPERDPVAAGLIQVWQVFEDSTGNYLFV